MTEIALCVSSLLLPCFCLPFLYQISLGNMASLFVSSFNMAYEEWYIIYHFLILPNFTK